MLQEIWHFHQLFLGIKPKTKKSLSAQFCLSARGLGFEPRYAGPEPAVLPLDDPRIILLFPTPPASALRAGKASPRAPAYHT